MITIDRLRYFQEVAKVQHVGRAAKKLNISASVISAAIQVLEDELGHELFTRSKQRIQLNPRGQALLDQVSKILNDVANLGSNSDGTGDQLKGHYRLGASHFLMQKYLLPACLELKKKNEELTFEFCSIDTGVALARIESGAIDLALVFRSSYYKSFKEQRLHSGQFEIVVRNDHPILKIKKERRIEELNQLPAITFRTSMGGNFWESHPAFGKLGIIPKHTYFYEDTQTALSLLKNTDGWAFLPNAVTHQFLNAKGGLSKLSFGESLVAPVDISIVYGPSPQAAVFSNALGELVTKRINIEAP